MGVTVWAFLSAARSIRSGNATATNRYFRFRLYAQGFTVVAMLGGSYYYNADRLKRGEWVKLQKQREAQEKKEAWIRELEARDEEDVAWRTKMGKVRDAQKEEAERKAVEEMRAREDKKGKERERSDDGRGVIAAIKHQANAAKAKENRLQEVEKETMGKKRAGPKKVVEEEKKQVFEQETNVVEQGGEQERKSLLGESQAGGLFGIGHLKALWEIGKGTKPGGEDEPKK